MPELMLKTYEKSCNKSGVIKNKIISRHKDTNSFYLAAGLRCFPCRYLDVIGRYSALIVPQIHKFTCIYKQKLF
jgi:hypothetical protein